MSKKIAASVAAAVAVLTTLSACAAGDTETDPTKTPRPTITSTPVAGYVPPSGACEDGVATIITDLETIDLPEGCATVNVLTNASTITLGSVEHLVVEGADNIITVASADTIEISGDGNDVTHGGSPEVEDHGKNTVKAG